MKRILDFKAMIKEIVYGCLIHEYEHLYRDMDLFETMVDEENQSDLLIT